MAISSVEKTMKYLSTVVTDDYTVNVFNKEFKMNKVKSVVIQPSLFHDDICKCCGNCCGNFDTVFFGNELDDLKKVVDKPHQEFLDLCTVEPVFINGEERGNIVYTKPLTSKDSHNLYNRPNRLYCRWIMVEDEHAYCKIHEYRPITCGFPHMELYRMQGSDRAYLGHKQYGRNHQLGCAVDVKTDNYNISTLHTNIYWLMRLSAVADYLNIDTLLPQIISRLECITDDTIPKNPIIIQNSAALNSKLF